MQCIKDIYPSNKLKNTSSPTTHDSEESTAKANGLCEFFTNVAVSLKKQAFKLRDFVLETPKAENIVTNQKVQLQIWQLNYCREGTEISKTEITSIHKSSSIDDYNKFRPISVLPVLSKILERAVYTQFIQYIESNKILSKHQFSYKKKRSTELATIFLADT